MSELLLWYGTSRIKLGLLRGVLASSRPCVQWFPDSIPCRFLRAFGPTFLLKRLVVTLKVKLILLKKCLWRRRKLRDLTKSHVTRRDHSVVPFALLLDPPHWLCLSAKRFLSFGVLLEGLETTGEGKQYDSIAHLVIVKSAGALGSGCES